jgi:hypothetical protein
MSAGELAAFAASPTPRASSMSEAAPTSTASPLPHAAAPTSHPSIPASPATAAHAATASGAAPWFFGAAEPIRVDPTDVEARARLRRGEHAPRRRKAAWAGALAVAVVAAASVPLVAPGWLVPPGIGGDAGAARMPVGEPTPASTVVATVDPRSRGQAATRKAEADAKSSAAGAAAPAAPTSPPPNVAANGGGDGQHAPNAGPDPAGAAAAAADRAGTTTTAAVVDASRPASAQADASRSPEATAEPSTAALAAAARSVSPAIDAAPETKRDAKPTAVAVARPGTKPPARAALAGNGAALPPAVAMAPKTAPARAVRAAVPAAPAAAAAAAARPRVQLAAAAPTPSPSPRPAFARTWQDPAAPIPWAVAGRGAPRLSPARTTAVAAVPAGRAVAATLATTAAATAGGGYARGSGAPATSTAAPPSSGANATSPAAPATNAAATTPSGANAATTAATPATSPAAPSTVNIAAVARDLQPPPSAFPGARPRDAASTPSSSPPAAADAPPDLVVRANDVMARHVPRLAQQAERSVARVLYAAGRSTHLRDDDELRAATAAIARGAVDPLAGMTLLPRDAQQLNDAARAEYARRGGTPDVLMMQVRAFGANPMDAEVAGNLAFLLLRQRPAQPEAARQLALHALTLRAPRAGDDRLEDWATLAIASALTGRERDARNALLVTLALAPNVDRLCKAALDVVALYGERLRTPVEAMLQSAQLSRSGQQSPFCEWPPHWVASGAR